MTGALWLAAGLVVTQMSATAALTSPAVPSLAPSSALTLDEVLDSALASYPALTGGRADLEAAAGEQRSAAGAFDPVWRTRGWGVPVSGYPQLRLDSVVEVPTPLWGTTLSAGYRYTVGKVPSYYGERETWSGGEVRAGLTVPVLRNGAIDRRRVTTERAVVGQSLARWSLQQQQLELRRAAAVRYWEWVAAGQRRDIARGLLQLAQDRDRQLTQRTLAGDLARFDQQDNARTVAQRQAHLVSAQRGLEQAALELSLFLRDAHGQPVRPADQRLPEQREPDFGLSEHAQLSEVVARRPDVQRLQDLWRQAELESQLQRNQLLPALDLGVAVSKDLGVPTRPELQSLGPAELEFSLQLEVPLLLRAPRGRLEAARAASARLEAQAQLTPSGWRSNSTTRARRSTPRGSGSRSPGRSCSWPSSWRLVSVPASPSARASCCWSTCESRPPPRPGCGRSKGCSTATGQPRRCAPAWPFSTSSAARG